MSFAEIPGFYFTLDVVLRAIFPQNLNLMQQPQHRWLPTALLSSNHYMYLCFAWPGLLTSKLCTWFRVRDWIFPRMAEESQKFDKLVADLKCSLDTHAPEDGFYAAMQTATDPISQQRYPEAEIWKEVKMLTRAGKGSSRESSTTLPRSSNET